MDSELYRECLYSFDITIDNSDVPGLVLSDKRVIHNGMETAQFISLSMMVVRGIRISFSIDA
jgi:hypothetical protein